MPIVAHSARISSLDLKRGPSDVGFIMRYPSSQTAPGIRPLRGQKSLPYGEELSPIHSSTSRTSSNAMLGLPSAASMVSASMRISLASGTIANEAGAGSGTAVVDRRALGSPATDPPSNTLSFGLTPHVRGKKTPQSLAEP